MKFPNHIMIDINKGNINTSTQYWALKYVNRLTSSPFLVENFYSKKKLLTSKSNTTSNNLFTTTPTKVNVSKLFKQPQYLNSIDKQRVSSKLWSLFNIYFLRKERIYTKLKYSRVPQYDIVSGGLAMLLCGFLGFLICEKFGFELLDSGEFYMLFMYIVFTSFFIKLIWKITESTDKYTIFLNLKPLLNFYINLFNLLFCKLKSLLLNK